MREMLGPAVTAPVLLVACDYDGTLAPIVDDPASAHPDQRAISALRDLASLPDTFVAVISGRARADLETLLGGIPGALLIGGHGSEWVDGEISVDAAALASRLRQIAAEFPGARVEPKPTGAAFHYRQVDPGIADDAAGAAVAAAAELATRVVHGKRVVEFSTTDADKGRALHQLQQELSPDVTIFIGDDVTDEDAFSVLGPSDVAIKVGEGATAAQWRITNQREVSSLLEELNTRRSTMAENVAPLTPENFDAVLFDLDGVLTETASIHAAAWRDMFDRFLRQRAEDEGEAFVPFDIDSDYRAYVDGKPRYDGVRGFLESRNIELPQGEATDPTTANTVTGLGNRKNELVTGLIENNGVEPFPGAVRLVVALREKGIKTAVVSASANAQTVLEAAGIADLFDTRVDGVVAAELALPGKPAPDTFLEAARRLGVPPERAVVVEDAISGVRAGRSGGFGLVVGVGAGEHSQTLLDNGADVVVADLADLLTTDPPQ
ncbi:MAG: hypothetical protein BMS9Abin07_1539 [Acidimicrobiia bacterium]|nr:MAG: hypothetical protein BMS9Abin07_1539 [Acidimicrobiia bacterium]